MYQRLIMPSPPATEQSKFPPLPLVGPPEDSAFAQQNFEDRKRVSTSWWACCIPRAKAVVPFKRHDIHRTDAEFSRFNIDSDQESSEPVCNNLSTISLINEGKSDTNKAHLFQWAILYENQRGYDEIAWIASRLAD